jgi:hypothetical protein
VPPKYQQNIDFDNLSNIKTLEKLFEETDTSKQNAIDSRWTFTRKNKETVIIRDVFLKIIRWADSFKQVGDIVIQYDPGHAALPWAGIRFLLQVRREIPTREEGINTLADSCQ